VKKNSNFDANAEAKHNLLEILNSKASVEDLNQMKFEKTNKSDTDM